MKKRPVKIGVEYENDREAVRLVLDIFERNGRETVLFKQVKKPEFALGPAEGTTGTMPLSGFKEWARRVYDKNRIEVEDV